MNTGKKREAGRERILPDSPRRLSPGEATELCEKILDKYHRQILAMVYSFTGDYHIAEDITQESFLKLDSHIRKKKVDGRLIAWLRRVATNAAVDSVRRNSSDPEMVSLSDGIDGYSIPPISRQHLDICRRIGLAMDKLPKKQRSIFEQRAIDNADYGEIADTHGCTQISARKIFQRARDAILAGLGVRSQPDAGDDLGRPDPLL